MEPLKHYFEAGAQKCGGSAKILLGVFFHISVVIFHASRRHFCARFGVFFVWF
jgi:hypothetical protein